MRKSRTKGRADQAAAPPVVTLQMPLPVRVVFEPDTQVQESVRPLFATFARTGALHATVRSFRQQGVLFPTRVAAGARKGELAWAPLSLGRASSALHNPWYAGAYAYGRGRWRKRPDGRARRERLPQAQWHVLIREAHPAYVSWPEYERNQPQLLASARAIGCERSRGAPREGPAVLQGHAVYGVCGSRMHVRYNHRRGGALIANYVCVGRGKLFGDPLCQSILGTAIDAAIGALLVEAVTPMALDLALAIQQEIATRLAEADRLRHRQVERAQYEVARARHRSLQVDPANRLVASSLEATGTRNCAVSPRPRKTPSASVPPTGSSSTSTNVSGSCRGADKGRSVNHSSLSGLSAS